MKYWSSVFFISLFFNLKVAIGQKNLLINHYKVENNILKFQCDQTRTNKLFLGQFSFPDHGTFHISLTPKGKVPEILKSRKPLPFKLIDSKEMLKLISQNLIVTINKNDFTFKLQRKPEKSLFTGKIIIKKHPESGQPVLQLKSNILPQEKFYGLGERLNGFNQRGNRVVMELSTAYLGSGTAAYKSIPFYFSSRDYAFLANSGKRIIFDLGNKVKDRMSVIMPDQQIDFYFFTSHSPIRAMKQYTGITGRSPKIPSWSLEPWISRRRYANWNNPKTVKEQVEQMINHGTHFGVVLWEGITGEFGKFHNGVADMINYFHSRNIKVVRWTMTGIILKTAGNRKKFKYNEEPQRDYFIQYKNGDLLTANFTGGIYNPDSDKYAVIFIDPTNPKAMSWWFKTKYAKSFIADNGKSTTEAYDFDGVKLDYSEAFPSKVTASELIMNKPIKGIANEFAVIVGQQVYNYLQKVRPDGGIIWQRGGGLGLQKVGPVWNGDRLRSFPEFKNTVESLLAVSTSGVALAGHDLGGYVSKDNPYAPEVYMRGVEFATFSPFFQDHGTARAPFEQTEYGRKTYAFYTRVRYNLMPYLENLVWDAHQTGLPMMRPLFFYNPDDSLSWNVSDSYYLGPDLLVAPVVDKGTLRKIYLPQGKWVNIWTNLVYEGGQTINYYAPLNRIPVFVRKQACLPWALNKNMQVGGNFKQKDKDNLLPTYEIFAGSDRTYHPVKGDNQFSIKYNVINGKKIKIELAGAKKPFGLIIHVAMPDRIVIQNKIVTEHSGESFTQANEGWVYNKKMHELKIKVNPQLPNVEVLIKGNNLLQDQYQEGILSVTTPKAVIPEIIGATPYDGSIDIAFDREFKDRGLTYIFENINNHHKYLMPPGTGNQLTIAGLKNGETYSFRAWTTNGKTESPKTKPIIVQLDSNKHPVYKFKNKKLFIGGNHFTDRKRIQGDSIAYVYSINNVTDEQKKVKIWAKVEKNISIYYQYPRLYPVKSIKLKRGEQNIKLQFPAKYEVTKIYLTPKQEERPIFKKDDRMSRFVRK